MQESPISRPNSSSGFRPSTSKHDAPVAPPNHKLQAAVDKHGSFMDAFRAMTNAEFANKLVQMLSVFYDRCKFLDSRISPSGYLSWTEMKGVFTYLHIQKLVSERNLRILFSDLGKRFCKSHFKYHRVTAHQDSPLRIRIMLFRLITQVLSMKSSGL